MREDILLSHLTRSDFSQVQAETLSKILSEMATKEYIGAQLTLVRKDFAAELVGVRGELAVVRERLDGVEGRMATKEELAGLRSDLAERIDRQTRWMVTLVLLLATLLGLPATILGLLNYLG